MNVVQDQHVSGTMVLSLLAFLRERGFPRRDLLAAVDHEEVWDFFEPSGWVPFATYIDIIEEAETSLEPEDWLDAGRRLFQARWLQRVGQVVGWTIPRVDGAYDWLMSHVYGPNSAGFRPVTFALVRVRPGVLRVILRAPRDQHLPEGLVYITAGSLEMVPHILGGAFAEVEVSRQGPDAIYDVTYQQRGVWRMVRRLLLSLSPGAAEAARQREAFDRQLEERARARRDEAQRRQQEPSESDRPSVEMPTALAEEYDVITELGEGATGRVLLAARGPSRAKVAIKLLRVADHLESGTWEDHKRVFRREAETLSQVDSPHVVRLLDFGIEDDVPYIIMEYIEGVQLDDLLFMGPVPPDRGERIFREVCTALQAIHAEGIIHRDLTPTNILVDRLTGSARLLDFGFAKFAGEADELSVAGRVVGTPWYMAPETLAGEPDVRSDLYAAGMLLYRMLTGRFPYDARASTDIMVAHLDDPPRSFRDVAPHRNLPRRLEHIALRCLEKDPAHRYASAVEVLDALDDDSVGSRRRWLVIGLLLLVVGTLVAVVWFS